jgi:hypothetical protein
MFCLARGLFVGRLSLPRRVAETGRSREESDAFERVPGVQDVPILFHVLCFVWQGGCLSGACLCHAALQRQAGLERKAMLLKGWLGCKTSLSFFMYYVLLGKGLVCRAPVFATQHGRDRTVQRGERCF